MDKTDRTILTELRRNCRISYEQLARSLDITANSVKRRISNLIDSGAIHSFEVRLTHAMVDVEPVLALAEVTKHEEAQDLIDLIGNHPYVTRVGFDSQRWLIIWAEYQGIDGLAEFSAFLRAIEGIGEVEINPLINQSFGAKCELSRLQLKVLKVLMEDPRMSLAKIASKAEMTTKRVRKILHELQESDAVVFTARQNTNASNTTRFVLRLSWDEKITTAVAIENWFKENYPDDFWFTLVSAAEARMFAIFISEHIRRSDAIAQEVGKQPGVNYILTAIPYPAKFFPGLRDIRLQEMIEKTGL